MKTFQQKYIILSSPSGGGKTTLAKRLLQKGLGLDFSISATTRKPRKGETKKDYYFMDEAEFRLRKQKGDFIETEEVYKGRFYGTLKSEIAHLEAAQKHVLFDVDVKGAQELKAYFKDRALSIFIQPPSWEAVQSRLRARALDSAKDIDYRMERYKKEMEKRHNFDQIVRNDVLDEAFEDLYAYVRDFLRHDKS